MIAAFLIGATLGAIAGVLLMSLAVMASRSHEGDQ